MNRNLVDAVARFYHDPLGFVLFAFPWGKGELAKQDGPDRWQVDVLNAIAAWSQSGSTTPLRLSVSSGHGIGKGACSSWLILWFMSTRTQCRGVVTANTKNQLSGKTWAELAKWHRLAINQEWFSWTKTRFSHSLSPETWFFEAIPWTRERSEAFAGLHAEHVMVLFDEASGIDDKIWEVAEGALTTGGIFAAFGNPTRSDGAFSRCFKEMKHRWCNWQVDSRTAKMTNKKTLQQWIDDYGIDSDFVKVRVLGKFPRLGTFELIPESLLEACTTYQATGYEADPLVLGVDVARFGSDSSVVIRRQGRKVFGDIRIGKTMDTTAVADMVAEEIHLHRPQAVFVDEIGIGGGVVDRLYLLGFQNIIGVQSAARAQNDGRFHNLRAEMWWNMKEWIGRGASLPDNKEMLEELKTPQYFFTGKGKTMMENKREVKSRLGRSPDLADALAMTFAHKVAPPVTDSTSRKWLAGNQYHGKHDWRTA